MVLCVVGLVLFFVIFFLILLYHVFVWNSDWLSFGLVNPRCWFSSFECGFCSGRTSESYFSYTYFTLLVFFVVFDLEISLLLNVPFELCFFKNVSYFFFFLFILCLGYGVEVYSGYVRWNY